MDLDGRPGSWVKIIETGRVGTLMRVHGTCQGDIIDVKFFNSQVDLDFHAHELKYASLWDIVVEYFKRKKHQF